MANKKLVIVGAGEFALIAYEYFTYDSEYEVCAFSVEKKFIKETTLNNLPVTPLESLTEDYPPKEYEIYVAVTYTQLNRVRTRFYKELKNKNYTFASYVSSKAFVWRNVEIGENTFIFENNVLQPFSKIGSNVVLWSGNHIGHRTMVEDNVYISSHCVISGYCTIGENSFLGVNATFADKIRIAKDNLIGAGAVILRNTEENRVYQGNPAEASKVSSLRLMKVKD